MRVLAIMPALPYPLTDGIALRAFHFLRQLAQGHKVFLVHFGPPLTDAKEVEQYTAGRRAVPRKDHDDGSPRGLGRALRALRLGYVWPMDPAMAAAVRESVAEFRPDVIWCTHLEMAGYARLGRRRRTIVDIIDDQVLHRRQQPARPGLVGSARKLKQLLDVGLNEARCGWRAAAATFASRADAAAFRSWAPFLPCEVVVNGVDTVFFQPGPVAQAPAGESPYVVFVGNYTHPPNAEAVDVLARRIWPAVRAKLPGLRCLVIGPNLPDALRQAATAAGIEVLGWVDDVRPHLAGATAFICPLVSGQGVKNKVLEAWAMGKAVVAMPAGLAGLENHAGQAALVARDEGEFVAYLSKVVGDPACRQSLGDAGRRIVEQSYTWERCAGRFGQIIESVGSSRV